jgi:hypothetical protein
MSARLSNRWIIALQLIFVVTLCGTAVVILLSMGVMNRSAGSHSLNFRVEASGGYAIITLQAGNVTISKPTTVTVPWSKTVQVSSGSEVYLTASNPTQTGKLTCTITLDKMAWKTETTTAPKDGVACAGIVP